MGLVRALTMGGACLGDIVAPSNKCVARNAADRSPNRLNSLYIALFRVSRRIGNGSLGAPGRIFPVSFFLIFLLRGGGWAAAWHQHRSWAAEGFSSGPHSACRPFLHRVAEPAASRRRNSVKTLHGRNQQAAHSHSFLQELGVLYSACKVEASKRAHGFRNVFVVEATTGSGPWGEELLQYNVSQTAITLRKVSLNKRASWAPSRAEGILCAERTWPEQANSRPNDKQR